MKAELRSGPVSMMRAMNLWSTHGLWSATLGWGAAFLVLACGSDRVCDPGTQQYCPCPGGSSGIQVCSPSGASWSVCGCSGDGGSDAGPQVDGDCSQPGAISCGWDLAGTDDDIILECHDGSYRQVFECPAMQDCITHSHQTTVQCGTGDYYVPYGILGNPCAAEGSTACVFDQSAVLICDRGIWTIFDQCEGDGVNCQHVPPGWSSGATSCPATSENGCTVCA